MQESLIDMESALERIGGDEEFLVELLNDLLEQLDENIPAIRQAIASSEFETLRSLSHGLKGASANLSVVGMASLFKELEDMGRNQTIDGAAVRLMHIEKAKQDLQELLKTM